MSLAETVPYLRWRTTQLAQFELTYSLKEMVGKVQYSDDVNLGGKAHHHRKSMLGLLWLGQDYVLRIVVIQDGDAGSSSNGMAVILAWSNHELFQQSFEH